MKCPLTTVISTVARSPEAKDWGDCIKEECAWWDDSDEHCCIVDIASSLSMVMSFLKDITEDGIPRRGG